MKLFYADHFVLPLPPGHRFPMEKYSRLRETLMTSGVFAPGDFQVPAAADDTAQATSRLVIVGDSDWLRPDLIGQAQFANVDFLEATVGWLAERTELIAVPARKANVQAVVMTRADLDAVLFRVLVLLPLSVLLLGGAVWWSRRT